MEEACAGEYGTVGFVLHMVKMYAPYGRKCYYISVGSGISADFDFD